MSYQATTTGRAALPPCTCCRGEYDAPPVRVMRRLGVNEATLRLVPCHDWELLEGELDRLSAYGYGSATQYRFLHEPHPLLGMTPTEALSEPGGFEEVRRSLNAMFDTLEGVRS